MSQVLDMDSGARGNLRPMVRKQHFTLERPTSHDSRSDVTRLLDALGRDVQIQPDQVRFLPAFLRANDWRGTAVLSGARLIGEGESLARALEKLELGARRIPMDVNPAQAQAYIVNPLTGRQVQFANLFRTHPSTEERIARLRTREWAGDSPIR